MARMARAVVKMATAEVGTRKLGEVFRVLVNDYKEGDFKRLLAFSGAMHGKSRSWHDTAKEIIEGTDHRSFYLRNMLEITLDHFREEVNTIGDRAHLKRLVALIRAKRDLRKRNPTNAIVADVLSQLEKKDYFGRGTRDE
jgi:hypothetical protein